MLESHSNGAALVTVGQESSTAFSTAIWSVQLVKEPTSPTPEAGHPNPAVNMVVVGLVETVVAVLLLLAVVAVVIVDVAVAVMLLIVLLAVVLVSVLVTLV